MRQTSVELAVGDSVRVHEHILTVIDIHGEEVTFRLDQFNADDAHPMDRPSEAMNRRTPR